MTGAGNDFVVIDNRSKQIKDGAGLARRLCDRRWGVGADGMLLLEPSSAADYRMMYYNADGSYGGMCGNGGRCIAAFANMRGLAGASQRFEALDYVYSAILKDGLVELLMKDPRDLRTNIVLPIGGKRLRMHFVDTGSPHVVIMLSKKDDLAKVAVERIGRQIRNHREFKPEGTNVNFVKLERDNGLSIRTYERGVESETLACGTGSIASAVIAHETAGLMPPIRIVPRSGETLEVNFAETKGGIREVKLKGPAKVVFEGNVEI